MEWLDRAVVLGVRPFGERDAVVSLFAREHGRHPGLVRGGQGRRHGPLLQPGNELQAQWRARLADQLGAFTVELLRARAGVMLASAPALAGLSAVTALLDLCLPEREPHARLFDGLIVLLDLMEAGGPWPALMVRFELELLAELGYGLDLASCAATGATEDLTHVSPRSGRAVSAAAAAPYGDRLLRLPGFLAGRPDEGDVLAGFALTGHFLEQRVLAPQGRALPAARGRLLALLGRGGAI